MAVLAIYAIARCLKVGRGFMVARRGRAGAGIGWLDGGDEVAALTGTTGLGTAGVPALPALMRSMPRTGLSLTAAFWVFGSVCFSFSESEP